MGTINDMEDMAGLVARAGIESEIGVVLPTERAQERLRSRLPGGIWSSLMDVLPELTRLADTA
jgi:hypothetical protein